jgi:hypothetical protein
LAWPTTFSKSVSDLNDAVSILENNLEMFIPCLNSNTVAAFFQRKYEYQGLSSYVSAQLIATQKPNKHNSLSHFKQCFVDYEL